MNGITTINNNNNTAYFANTGKGTTSIESSTMSCKSSVVYVVPIKTNNNKRTNNNKQITINKKNKQTTNKHNTTRNNNTTHF